MKFKTLAAASLAVATMLGMGACGSNSTANKTTSDGKTIITFWHNSTTGITPEFLRTFGFRP